MLPYRAKTVKVTLLPARLLPLMHTAGVASLQEGEMAAAVEAAVEVHAHPAGTKCCMVLTLEEITDL